MRKWTWVATTMCNSPLGTLYPRECTKPGGRLNLDTPLLDLHHGVVMGLVEEGMSFLIPMNWWVPESGIQHEGVPRGFLKDLG